MRWPVAAMSPEALLERARAARGSAYAPYSKFAVGAAVETLDGDIVIGCNVENASYGLSICAERAALVQAIALGHRSFRAIAIAGPEGAVAAPCGACRQFIVEFGEGIAVLYLGPAGLVQTSAGELLPHAFGPHSLA